MKYKNTILISLFSVLYAAVALVSTYHAIAFFSLANPVWLAVILAISFEVGQAAVLFSLLTNASHSNKQILPWVLMCTLTIVQILGNVFSSYKYMLLNHAEDTQYFTKSVLFFMQSPNPEYNYVMISYITGAILPVVALCLTAMIVYILKSRTKKEEPTFERKIVG